MPDGYLILDEDGRVADSNTVARELVAGAADGVDDPRDVVGSDVDDLLDAIRFREGREAPLDEGQFAVERGGDTRYVELQSTVLEDDGFFIGRLVALRDVTTTVRAERQLRQERREFETLFTHMRDPVSKVRFEGGTPVLEAVNPAFAETFGVDRDGAVGRRLEDLLVPEDRRAAAADLNQRIQAGDSVKREIERETRAGRRDFLLRSAPVEDPDRRVAYLIYTDITDEKRRQRELERQNRRLDQFASIVSHDLRNPLNVAQGLLRNATDGEELEGAVREAVQSLDRMEAMIDDVLTLARQGEDVGEPDPVRLDAIAGAAWENVDTRSATLSVDGGLTLRADPDRLLQLFENLYRNSVEHGSTGSRTASGDSVEHGSTGNRPEAGDAVEHAGDDVAVTVGVLEDGTGFFVADDGPGIPPAEREDAFEHGYTTEPDGTGFGLSIVSQIAAAHGWTVDAAESAGGGARFEVTGIETAGGDAGGGSADRGTGA